MSNNSLVLEFQNSATKRVMEAYTYLSKPHTPEERMIALQVIAASELLIVVLDATGSIEKGKIEVRENQIWDKIRKRVDDNPTGS